MISTILHNSLDTTIRHIEVSTCPAVPCNPLIILPKLRPLHISQDLTVVTGEESTAWWHTTAATSVAKSLLRKLTLTSWDKRESQGSYQLSYDSTILLLPDFVSRFSHPSMEEYNHFHKHLKQRPATEDGWKNMLKGNYGCTASTIKKCLVCMFMSSILDTAQLRNSLDACDQAAHEVTCLGLTASDLYDAWVLNMSSAELSDKRSSDDEWKLVLTNVTVQAFTAISCTLKTVKAMKKVIDAKDPKAGAKKDNDWGANNTWSNSGGGKGAGNSGGNWGTSNAGKGGNWGAGNGWGGNNSGAGKGGGNSGVTGTAIKCAAHQYGRCARGDSCRFRHEPMSTTEFENYVLHRKSSSPIPLPPHLGGPQLTQTVGQGNWGKGAGAPGPYAPAGSGTNPAGFPPSGFPALANG
jgi:hypothetical protein